MKLAIMQPTFNPWLGYFDLINSTDLFIFLNQVQLDRRSWQTRNKLKVNNQEFLVTIPIKKERSRDNTTIDNATINDWLWAEKAVKTIESNYKKSKYYEEVFPFIQSLLISNKSNKLAEFNINIITAICEKIGITTKMINASSLKEMNGKKDEMLLNICKSMDATEYTSPPGSSNYLIENSAGETFEDSKISLFYQNYIHPVYPQVGKSFISHIGIFDLLLNVGFSEAESIIKSGHQNRIYYKDFNENK